MKTIDVAVVAYPDGSTIHIRDATSEQIRKANEGWWGSLTDEELTRHHDNRTGGGMVVIRMLESDYEAMHTSNHPGLVALSGLTK